MIEKYYLEIEELLKQRNTVNLIILNNKIRSKLFKISEIVYNQEN
jgi:hypothetical protein